MFNISNFGPISAIRFGPELEKEYRTDTVCQSKIFANSQP